eukprot:15431689-Alexandrium_andersonii.AAC.1
MGTTQHGDMVPHSQATDGQGRKIARNRLKRSDAVGKVRTRGPGTGCLKCLGTVRTGKLTEAVHA